MKSVLLFLEAVYQIETQTLELCKFRLRNEANVLEELGYFKVCNAGYQAVLEVLGLLPAPEDGFDNASKEILAE